MTLPANVTPLSEGRALTQDRVTYRAADGKHKETYLGIPSSLLPRLFEASLAEVRLLLYVWQRTGGWKGYHTNPEPVRITFAEWLGGRPGYAQDTGAHLCKQVVADTRDALVARGWLYEERETPHERGPRRYALVAPDHPGVGPYQRADGQWEVLLLTNEGAQPYHVPEPLLQHRKEGEILLDSRKDAFLRTRKACPGPQETVVLDSRKEKSRRSFPGAGQTQPISNVLTNSTIKQELSKSAADAATTQEHQLQGHLTKQQGPSAPSEHQSAVAPLTRDVGATPAPAAPLSKPALFPPEAPEPAPALRSSARTGTQTKRKRAASAHTPATRQTEAQSALEARTAALVAAWLAHPATVQPEQMSETERRRFYSGMAKLARSSLTLEELPTLLDAQARWSRGTYTPDPHTMEASLGTLRRETAAWNKQGAASQKGTAHAASQPRFEGHTGKAGSGGGADPTLFLIRPGRHAGNASAGTGTAAPGEAVPGV